MTLKERNTQTLRQIEKLIRDARQDAWKLGSDELYGKLDNALVSVQYLGMGLKLESESGPQS